MFVKTIAVSYERKFNLGDFNSATLGCSIWASISEGENEDMCTQLLQDKCREAVRKEYRKLLDKSKPAETFTVNGNSPVDDEFIPEGDIYGN
ncbi:MAG: hypothetical protein HEQ29_23975 [Dolichospermum sp. LBC05a]|nr:hypothetical protein [Dolichospermum sp. OL01]MCO5799663.1 hypothetical protein [Dolichospermum sp. OL03]QSV60989.1 MAG: hypothetical protein HEQ29_23975 [Dolichospermum sp. LBC05a]